MSKHLKIGLIIGAGLVAASLVVLVWRHHVASSPIPAAVKKQVNFSVFYPQNDVPGLAADRTTVSYDKDNGGMSYTVLVAGKKVVVTEQSTPSIFSEAGAYSFKLNQAHGYEHFSLQAGEVDLTRPDGLQNQTVAWSNAKGTFILAHALQSLTTDEWKLFFNNLHIS